MNKETVIYAILLLTENMVKHIENENSDCYLIKEYRELKIELNKIEEQESIQKQKDELEDKLYAEMNSAWAMYSFQRRTNNGYVGDLNEWLNNINKAKEDKTDWKAVYDKAVIEYEKVATTRTKPQCFNPFANI